MMASSICSLILDHSSEEALLGCPNFNHSDLHSLCRLIVKSLASNEMVRVLREFILLVVVNVELMLAMTAIFSMVQSHLLML